MATINASIGLTDNMTKVFHSISSAMDGVIDLFDQLDRETSDGLNNDQLVEARRRVDEMRSSVAQLEVGIDDATRSQDNLTNSVRESENQSKKLLDTIKNLVVAYAGIKTVQKVMDTSTELINIEARLNNINDGAQTTAELMDKVYASANRSYAGFTDVASAVAKLAGQTGKLFGSTDEVIAFTELLNKAFTIGGTTAEGKASAMLQLTQAMSSGVLRGEEFNALNENAGQLVQTIADYMGVEKGAMKELASEGKITADIIKNAIFSAGEDIDDTFNGMSVTFEDVKTRISNMAMQIFTPMWKQLEQFINSPAVQQAIAGIAIALRSLVPIVTGVLGVFVGIFNFVIDNWPIMGPIILGIASAVLIYAGATAYLAAQKKLLVFWESAGKIAAIASHAVTAIGIILSGFMTGATLAEVNAKILATGATITLTAAEYALLAPILLIIAIIIAVIGVIFLLVKAYNYLTGSSVSTVGLIVGAFYWLYSGIYNIFAWIWNIFVDIAEFLATVFSDPIYYVKLAFGSLAKYILMAFQGVLQGINKIADGIIQSILWVVNKGIDAINVMVDLYNSSAGLIFGTVNRLGHVEFDSSNLIDTSFVDNAIKSIDDWIGTSDAKEYDFSGSKAEYKDMGEYFDKGYQVGKDFEDSISGMFNLTGEADKIKDEMGEEFDYESYLDNAGMDGYGSGDAVVDGIADDTSLMADSMATAEEDLKYLIDVAKKNRVDSITNVDITVPVTMSNNINNGTDLTGAIDYMTQELTVKINEAMNTSAEGVHN